MKEPLLAAHKWGHCFITAQGKNERKGDAMRFSARWNAVNCISNGSFYAFVGSVVRG